MYVYFHKCLIGNFDAIKYSYNVVGRYRASFRQSFRFGNMALRDRGHRLAGYLTPPSDATTQEEEDAASDSALPCDTNRYFRL
jgi:hypothetical protein